MRSADFVGERGTMPRTRRRTVDTGGGRRHRGDVR